MNYPSFCASGEAGLLVTYGREIDDATNLRTVAAAEFIRRHGPAGIQDVVPAYASVLILYDPRQLEHGALLSFLKAQRQVTNPRASDLGRTRVRTLPTAYGGDLGPDMESVCSWSGLDAEQVAALHAAGRYRVYFLGFTPGFAYLGQVDPQIAVPRLETPRKQIPAGSVGLAGRGTGVYPYPAPGGWRLIGRTPVRLFDPGASEPVYFRPGDTVEFSPIEHGQYRQLTADAPAEPRQPPVVRPLARVEQPGLLTTLQDRGRVGSMHLGASRAGAADLRSLIWANSLVGNGPEAAALELTALGPTLHFVSPAVIALTGADMVPRLDGEPVPLWRSVAVATGSTLTMSSATSGLRGYLAVSGGFDAPLQLGSRSTDTVAWFGGRLDRPLRAGDLLGLARPGRPESVGQVVPADLVPTMEPSITVRAVPGPQHEHFTDESRRLLESCEFEVTGDSDRMGLRLRGSRPLPHSQLGPDIVSEGICPGAVQVPGSGHPIVMLSNAQTTGGYAKIATVITPDLGRLAQLRPGDGVGFSLVTVEQGQRLARAWWRDLSRGPARVYRYRVDDGTRSVILELEGPR